MKIVAQVKLLAASAHDADALAATLRACNRAANAASEVAFDRDLKRRNGLQEAVYHRIKATSTSEHRRPSAPSRRCVTPTPP